MAKNTTLEDKFLAIWNAQNGGELAREYRFFPGRKWRADFAHLASKTLIEIEGGIWSGGRHISPAGFVKDCDKYNAATLAGWKVIRLTNNHIKPEIIKEIINELC